MFPARWLTAVALLLAGAFCVPAHGPEAEQIVLLTAQLERHPDDLAARLRRGELLRDHARSGASNDLAAARTDFAWVLRSFPGNLPAQLGMARVEMDAGEITNALRRVDRILETSNQVATAHLLRAEALIRCARPAEAVAAYDAALQRQNDPRPETFLARARAQLAAAPTNFAAPLAGLDAGLARLGPVPGLQLLALDLATRAGNYSNALARLDALAAESDRHESWLSRRGDLLLAAGRPADARATWEKALEACRSLPPRFQSTATIQELQAALVRKLATKLTASPAAAQAPGTE